MSYEPEKPDYSCPHIDKIIKIENDIVKALESSHYDEFDRLLENVDEALWYRGDIETEAEKARDIHDKLRKWGEWQQERADELEKENEELKARVKLLADRSAEYLIGIKRIISIAEHYPLKNRIILEIANALMKYNLNQRKDKV